MLSLVLILFFINGSSVESAKIKTPLKKVNLSVSAVKPIKLESPVIFRIPKLKVNAKVESLGMTPQGAMDSTKGPNEVAWFNLGPKPGEIGSSVIAGHSGWRNNIPAAFDNLSKLKKGDKIYVEDINKVVTTFVVRESRTFDPEADATLVFSSSDGKAHLNLITCVGTWDVVKKSRSNRLVVFTDKII